MMLAVGTKILQIHPELFAWPMENLRPLPRRNPCYIAWDLSNNEEAFRWMAEVYQWQGRTLHARWALSLPNGSAPPTDPGKQ